MGQQSIPLTFPADPRSWFNLGPGIVNLADGTVFANSTWTSGVQLITPVTSQPQLTAPWQINGWALFLQGFQSASNFAGPATFGKLGKILAGPIFGPVAPVPAPGGVPQQLFQPIPASALPNIATVWDGSTDPAFPAMNQTGSVVPPGGSVAISVTPAQPINLSPGEPIGFGVWITPSLVQNFVILIANLSGTLTYDDGVA